MKIITKKNPTVSKNGKEIIVQYGMYLCRLIPFAEMERKTIAQDIAQSREMFNLRLLREE